MISMKDEKGQIINSPDILQLTTELVYSDGSPTPFMPLSPLKERRKSGISKRTLYRPLRPEPVLGPEIKMVPFSFRIEEVSFHHPGHTGFKLKVSCVAKCTRVVHPGVLKENIIVLSKPKHESKSEESNSFKTPNGINTDMIVVPHEGKTYSNITEMSNQHMAAIPLDKLVNGLLVEDNKCHCCGKVIQKSEFLIPASHEVSCHLVTNLLPFINSFSGEIKKRTNTGRQGRRIRSIKGTIKPKKKDPKFNTTSMKNHHEGNKHSYSVRPTAEQQLHRPCVVIPDQDPVTKMSPSTSVKSQYMVNKEQWEPKDCSRLGTYAKITQTPINTQVLVNRTNHNWSVSNHTSDSIHHHLHQLNHLHQMKTNETLNFDVSPIRCLKKSRLSENSTNNNVQVSYSGRTSGPLFENTLTIPCESKMKSIEKDFFDFSPVGMTSMTLANVPSRDIDNQANNGSSANPSTAPKSISTLSSKMDLHATPIPSLQLFPTPNTSSDNSNDSSSSSRMLEPISFQHSDFDSIFSDIHINESICNSNPYCDGGIKMELEPGEPSATTNPSMPFY